MKRHFAKFSFRIVCIQIALDSTSQTVWIRLLYFSRSIGIVSSCMFRDMEKDTELINILKVSFEHKEWFKFWIFKHHLYANLCNQ